MMRVVKGYGRLGTAVLSRGTRTTQSPDLRTRQELSGVSKSGGRSGRGGQKPRRPGAKGGGDGGGTARSVAKGGSSGLWMKRHLKDPYVSAAIDAGAPSRAAFKLVEINDKHRVLSAGDRVVDLGAAPGGWSMVAARIVHARGARGSQQRSGRSSKAGAKGGTPPQLPPPLPAARVEAAGNRGRRGGAVVAVDLLELQTDLPGVEAIRGDFRDAGVESKIIACLSARERPSWSENSQQQQQQQQQQRRQPQPTTRHSTTTSAAEQSDSSTITAERNEHNGDGDGNTSSSGGDDRVRTGEDAFLLRGTSASSSLLPRPEQPTTDHLGDLFLAANPPAPETAMTAAQDEAADPTSPLARLTRRLDRVVRVRDESLRPVSNLPRPAASPSPPRPPIRRANVVLSDMAPSFSGDRDTDQARVAGLVLDALAACLGDETWRRRETLRSGAKGETGRGGGDGSDSEGCGVWEGDDRVEREGEDRGGASGDSSASTTARRGQGAVGPLPVETIPGPNAVGTRGSGGSSSSSTSHSRGSPRPPEPLEVGSAVEPPTGGMGLLARGGTFLGKFFAGRDEREVKDEASRLFEKVRVVKPPASRSSSGEMYLLATGFLLGGHEKHQ
eukprot:g12223.t1